MDKTLYTIIVHSENFAGLLNQVTAVFTRRQINIESLNVSASSIKGVHKYTITAWTDKDTIEKVTKQITKKIDVLQAHYFTDDEIYQHEIALYKITTPILEEKPEVSKVIRKYNARIVEVNAVFAIVEKNGMGEEITNLYDELRALDCVLQFVRSGRVAITTSCFERVNEYLADRETKYRLKKKRSEIMSENSSKIGKYQFVAEPFHVDFTGRLTMGVLGNHLLNCAGFHASDRGFGIATLNEDNYTWVLSRLAIELDEMPFQYEDFTIWTWVENVYRLFTDRDFALLDKDGKKIGYARSVWAMINLNTRKPADLLALHGGSIVDYVCDEPCPIEKPSRIKVTSTEPVATLKAKYSDIDINGHVNSIRYIEHIMDLFPIEMYKEKRIRRFEMAYVAESYYDDELTLYKDELGDGAFDIEVKKNGSEVVCRSKVIFTEK